MKKVLLTGFGPFLDNEENPSEQVCDVIQADHPEISTVVLPVEYRDAFLKLKESALLIKPDYIIMMGLASKRSLVSLEKVAFNWNESEQPDGSGMVAGGSSIDPDDAQLATMTSFPVRDVYQILKAKEFPVEISFSAGTYVCNNLFYKVLKNFPDTQCMFVHLPDKKSVPLPEQVKMIKEILVYCLRSN